ncbi:hypothetical protein QJS10_CPB14g01367 [Acorus calamus]|uniref:Uncharacterized protein n=1 Tax=Acorus calamus TaxID=4465 RepID=A0AAV9DEL1_ACOCL|nr:hypothetical protein QJS10_CPB14g01367 [Acorus calamus]
MVLLFIVVIQPAMAARVVMTTTDAKPERTTEVADAELDQQKGIITYRSLLQKAPSVPSYRALQKNPPCFTNPGRPYHSSYKRCFRGPPGSP